ncbi:unnamed protein product [Heterobilharzia americana]|nr:unnamed protein product [Heterobilharzia americana]
MTTTSINNMDDLVGITTGLLNTDRNFLIRLARLIGSLGQMNGSLVTLDQDINIWKDELREKAIQTIIQLQESIIESKLKSKPYLEPFVHEEKDYFNDLLIIFLNPIYKTPENCLNSLKKTTFSIDEMYSLCQYHQYIFNYLTKPAIVSLFSSVLSSLKCQNLDSHDHLLYEIFQSIRLHHIPVEAISGGCYSTASVESNFQLNEENPNGKRSNKSTANTSSSPPLPSIDLKHLRSKLNSGSTGVEIIQSTLVFMSSAMKNTMNKHLTEKPKAKLASFAADVYSNLRLPFRNQSTNDINTSNRTLTKHQLINQSIYLHTLRKIKILHNIMIPFNNFNPNLFDF